MKRWIAPALAGLALAAALLAACGDDDNSSATKTTTGTPDKVKDVTVGYVPQMVFAPLFVAQEKGYFREAGLNVKLERLGGGADMLVQTAAGNFDVGAAGLGVAVFNAAAAAIKDNRDVPFEVVAPLHAEKPPVVTPLVVSKARFQSGEITKIADLKGKTVAISARGGSLEYWLEKALEQGGLTFKDIKITVLAFPDVPAALGNKGIDAAMLGEPFRTLAEDQGTIKVLTDDFVDGESPTGVYWNRDWAKKNPEAAAGFLAAYTRAVTDLESGGWNDAAPIIEKYTTVAADVVKRANRPHYDPSGKVDVAGLKKQEAFFRAQGLLTYEGDLDWSKFVRN